jgi:hypothetical protein
MLLCAVPPLLAAHLSAVSLRGRRRHAVGPGMDLATRALRHPGRRNRISGGR